ncbi:MAG: hypothetical protein ACREGI_03810 [Candidatus Levyibacteriota bacterium]
MNDETRRPIIIGAIVVIIIAAVVTFFVGKNIKEEITSQKNTPTPAATVSLPTAAPTTQTAPTTPPTQTDTFYRTVYAVMNQEVSFTLIQTAGNAPIQWMVTTSNGQALQQVISNPYQVAYIAKQTGTFTITANGTPTCLPNCNYHLTKHVITVIVNN